MEDSKGGVEPGNAVSALVKHIIDACPSLRLEGLMTSTNLALTKSDRREVVTRTLSY